MMQPFTPSTREADLNMEDICGGLLSFNYVLVFFFLLLLLFFWNCSVRIMVFNLLGLDYDLYWKCSLCELYSILFMTMLYKSNGVGWQFVV